MTPVTMKDDALPQIHLVRDTDLGVFAYGLHILAGDFLRESEFNLRSLATNTGPDSIAIMGRNTPAPGLSCSTQSVRRTDGCTGMS